MTHLILGLGGGCHWCTEAVFQAVEGVSGVEQGFIRSVAPDEAWSEAVRLTLDEATTPLDALLDIHLRTHSSTSDHAMRGKYRSAVYVGDWAGGRAAEAALGRLAAGFDRPLVTRVLPLQAFRASEARFRDYYATDPDRPFCRTYIEPKLAWVRGRRV